jgi:hypothetical protein
VANYLVRSTEPEAIYIDMGFNQYLTILSGRAQTRDYILDNEIIRNSISSIGFAKTMSKYNICCAITSSNELEYERFLNLFGDFGLSEITYKRSNLIREDLGQIEHSLPDYSYREQLINELNLKSKFILVKEFGPYKIYHFRS